MKLTVETVESQPNTFSICYVLISSKIIFTVTYLKNSSSSLEVVRAEDEVEMLFSLEDILLTNYQIL